MLDFARRFVNDAAVRDEFADASGMGADAFAGTDARELDDKELAATDAGSNDIGFALRDIWYDDSASEKDQIQKAADALYGAATDGNLNDAQRDVIDKYI
jgi:hypothetical protein